MDDYYNRISVMTWVLLFGLASAQVLTLPARILTWHVLGSPLSITFATNSLLMLLLAAAACSGTAMTLKAHPLALSGQLRHGWAAWALPSAEVIVAVELLPRIQSQAYWLVALLATGAVLAGTLAALYRTVDPQQPGYRPARALLILTAYATALFLFLFVYTTRTRTLLSGGLIAFSGGLLALELLRGVGRPLQDVGLYALITAAVLGEATWALNYWGLPGLTGGLLLLWLFYLIVGPASQHLQGHLNRRAVVEFLLTGLIAIFLIWRFAP
ncbi:MAG TPA: hypothetical protein EYP04_10840 [Anaerolineae bacterium]|nr:hypothetical protein [Anaerolineae bacterium]